MKTPRYLEIEEYIEDWFWDEQTHKFAFELGSYLFDFMEDLEENSGLKENTIRRHFVNCSYIGLLICQYGCYDKFLPEIFACPPYHDIEFRRKFSDSKYQIQSYNSTCKKLEKYAIKKGDLSYIEHKF